MQPMLFGKTPPIVPDRQACRPNVTDRERLQGAPPAHRAGTGVRKSQDNPKKKPGAEMWTETHGAFPCSEEQGGEGLKGHLYCSFGTKGLNSLGGGSFFKNESNRDSKRKTERQRQTDTRKGREGKRAGEKEFYSCPVGTVHNPRAARQVRSWVPARQDSASNPGAKPWGPERGARCSRPLCCPQ